MNSEKETTWKGSYRQEYVMYTSMSQLVKVHHYGCKEKHWIAFDTDFYVVK